MLPASWAVAPLRSLKIKIGKEEKFDLGIGCLFRVKDSTQLGDARVPHVANPRMSFQRLLNNIVQRDTGQQGEELLLASLRQPK